MKKPLATLILAALACGILASCARAPDRSGEFGLAAKKRGAAGAIPAESANAPIEAACIDALTQRADFAPIGGKVFLGAGQGQPSDMLNISDKPTDAEKPVVAAWGDARQDCYRQGQAWREQHRVPQEIADVVKDINAKFLLLTADLTTGKITYGEYAKGRRDLVEKAKIEMDRTLRFLGAGGRESQSR
jgi:hypothetical protein